MVINIEDLPPEVQERIRKQEQLKKETTMSDAERRHEQLKKETTMSPAERAKAIEGRARAKAIVKRGGKIVRYLAGVKEKGERKGRKGKERKGRKGKATRVAQPRGVRIPTGDIQVSAMQSGSPMHGGKMTEEAFDIGGFGDISRTKKGIGLSKSSFGLGKSSLGLGKWKL